MSKRRAIEYEDYLSLENEQLFFVINEESYKHNLDNYNKIKPLLKKAGISLEIAPFDTGKKTSYSFSLKFMPTEYITSQRRLAGSKRKKVKFINNEIGIQGDDVHYSDVILMMQTMNDKEIMDKLGMKYATYYRHKKRLLESDYFKLVDKNQLNDELYLKSGDLTFEDNWF